MTSIVLREDRTLSQSSMLFKNIADFTATHGFVFAYDKSIIDFSVKSVSTELKTFWVWVFHTVMSYVYQKITC